MGRKRTVERVALALIGVVIAASIATAALLWPRTAQTEPEQIPVTLRPVHIIGDSFAANPWFQDATTKAMPGREVTFDAVSGSSLADEYDRFQRTPEHWGDIVIILDGGLNEGEAALPTIRKFADMLNACNAWAYVEPGRNANHPKGSFDYDTQIANVRTVRDEYPAHFLPSWQALADKATTADDRADVAKGLTPRSLRNPGDVIHPNAKGSAIFARLIAARVSVIERRAPADCRPVVMEGQ